MSKTHKRLEILDSILIEEAIKLSSAVKPSMNEYLLEFQKVIISHKLSNN